MAITPNLELKTNDNVVGATKEYLAQRIQEDGNTNLNMAKIDEWAGKVDSHLETLENKKPIILAKATWSTNGYYETVTSEITELVPDMLVTLKLDKDNDGTFTMKINDLPANGFLKYDNKGTLLNLDTGDLRKNKEYQFRYDGTSFIWQSATSADQINIVGKSGNITSIDSDNTIIDSGVSASQVITNKNNIGDVTTLATKDKYSTVAAINENVSKIATVLEDAKVYTDKKVAELVDSAPETLDTLKELSNALGNDPNFATTITTEIGKKADKDHNHDDRYYTEAEADEKFAPKSHVSDTNNPHKVTAAQVGAAPVTHTHTKSQILDFAHYHDDRYYTETEMNQLLAQKAPLHDHPYIPVTASCNKNWNWAGQSGQPQWLWGGNDGQNMYVYSPRNFDVKSVGGYTIEQIKELMKQMGQQKILTSRECIKTSFEMRLPDGTINRNLSRTKILTFRQEGEVWLMLTKCSSSYSGSYSLPNLTLTVDGIDICTNTPIDEIIPYLPFTGSGSGISNSTQPIIIRCRESIDVYQEVPRGGDYINSSFSILKYT